ncbi:MAG: T9SS type A sorting domain-containing protein [bacterium]
MKGRFFLLLCLIGICVSIRAFSQSASVQFPLKKPTGEPMATLMNINNVSMWAQADGILGHNPDGSSGVIFPRGTACVVYTDGFLWGGFVKDGLDPELRVGGQLYRSGTVPGGILSKDIAENPNDPDVRIWRIRPDWQTADLTRDAAEFFNISVDSVAQWQIEMVRAQYEKDWNDWPWEKGAPFYDVNENGMMDDRENPGLANADQVVWFVANDLDSSKTFHFLIYGSPPIGLEMQITLWAYDRKGPGLNDALQNIIFKRVQLVYKGHSETPVNAHIDSLFFGQFVEAELGGAGDNFAGCDTLLQLGFGYNGYSIDRLFQRYNLPPPAFGYALVQGPMKKSDNPLDKGYFGFRCIQGFINLPMTAFWEKSTGSAFSDPWNPIGMYNSMNGYVMSTYESTPVPFWDRYGNTTKFMLSGDPLKGTGCIDGFRHMHNGSPGTRRFQMYSGPVSLAYGDTQEVIIAMVGGLGSDRLASVSVMKHYVKWARQLAQDNFQIGFKEEEEEPVAVVPPQDFRLYTNYPNPFNAGTEIRYDLPVQRHVRLTVYNILGRAVKVLVDCVQEAKSYAIQWDGMDGRGRAVPSGIYLYRLDLGSVVLTRKMLLVE